MYARVAAFEQPNVSMADDLINTVRERSQSARTELPDAQALLMLIDRENARSLGITFFESEEAIRQAEPAFERMGDEIPEETRGRRISVDVYEVVRQEGGEGAKAARVSSFEGPPDQIDEGVRRAEDDVLPRARQMPGWKGYYWLADRSSGRTKLDHPVRERGCARGERATGRRASAAGRGERRREDHGRRALRGSALRATRRSVVLSPELGRPPIAFAFGARIGEH